MNSARFALGQEINARLAIMHNETLLDALDPSSIEALEVEDDLRHLNGLANLWKAQQDPDKMARLAASICSKCGDLPSHPYLGHCDGGL